MVTGKRIYLAGPLFSTAERLFNAGLADRLRSGQRGREVIVPQERAAETAGSPSFAEDMYKFCVEMIETCDCVVAILDGPDVDSGTCVELGMAAAAGKRIVGVRTDARSGEDRGVNLMVARSCAIIVGHPGSTLDELAKEITRALASLKKRQECGQGETRQLSRAKVRRSSR